MCTVSWFRTSEGYVLACNRDERHTRKAALGPRLSKLGDVSYVAPIDGDHGGSWIAVNQFGLGLSLLNRYLDPAANVDTFISRGLLVTQLIDSATIDEVRNRLSSISLHSYRPFTLLSLDRQSELVFDWSGSTLSQRLDSETSAPLVSSSFGDPKVIEYRRQEFLNLVGAAGGVDNEVLSSFHCSHQPEQGPYSVCMHRDEAATKSRSIVTVDAAMVQFAYQAGPPCEGAEFDFVDLPVRHAQAYRAT
jgi:uncharacterized protein with NRDE domain